MKPCTPFGHIQFDPPANHDVELTNFEEMKQLTPQEFYRQYFGVDPSPLIYVEPGKACEFAQAYAEHLEETAWVSVEDELPPAEHDYGNLSINVIIGNDYRCFEGHFDLETGVCYSQSGYKAHAEKWRLFPKPPKQ